MGTDQVGDTCHWECQLRSSEEKWHHGDKRPHESHHASRPPRELSGLDFLMNHPTVSMSVTTRLHKKNASCAKQNTSRATYP